MNGKTGKVRRDPIDGVLLLDKPLGLSSNDALVRVRRLLNAAKAGHGGTLDPLATGLLPLLVGEATKFALDLLEADKSYRAEMLLGVTTTTGDAEGEVLERRPVAVDQPAMLAAIARFTGPILQVPPMYSALKRDGRPLYDYARAGQTVEREARPVTIHSITLDSLDGDRAVIQVRCSKGTYIRTLAEDIGQALGCGAHLVGLRRESVDVLRLGDAVTLDQLEALDLPARRARLAPLDILLSQIPVHHLDAALAARLSNGQRIRLDHSSTSPDASHRVRVYSADRLIGIATLVDGLLAPVRLVACAPATVPAALQACGSATHSSAEPAGLASTESH